MKSNDRKFMKLAIEEGKRAKKRGDYGFGAAVARGTEFLASGGNRVITKNDSIKHVELEVLQYAVGSQKERYLTGCTLYTTCEPCLLCFGAAFWSGISRIVYGISQIDLDKFGKESGTKEHRYRRSPLGMLEIMNICGPLLDRPILIKVEQFMKKECLGLLESK